MKSPQKVAVSPTTTRSSQRAQSSQKTTAKTRTALTYAKAGVDIETGDAFVDKIKPFAQKTLRKEVLAGIGGFGALCAIPKGYRQPILVSGTDGIGTKLKFGLEINRLEGLGQDLVAMCVNDVITLGAEPLFFLDYYACGQLDIRQGMRLMQGIAKGCALAGCALIGGETAEMPGLYEGRDFDMAGFAVGVVDKKKILDGQNIHEGDVLIGIASSGAHSNGFSLIRKILAQTPNWQNARLGRSKTSQTVAHALIAPTKIYAKAVKKLLKAVKIKGLAHITGGGLIGNVPRIIPEGLKADVLGGSWVVPPLFHWLQEQGKVSDEEMLRVFNLGIGMVAVVSQKYCDQTLDILQQQGETAWVIGELSLRAKKSPAFALNK